MGKTIRANEKSYGTKGGYKTKNSSSKHIKKVYKSQNEHSIKNKNYSFEDDNFEYDTYKANNRRKNLELEEIELEKLEDDFDDVSDEDIYD